MEEYGREISSDKITHHEYHKYYGHFFAPFYSRENACLLEIGIDTGGSLQLWEKLFPGFFVYGVDILAHDEDTDRHAIMACDQGNPSDLDRVVNTIVAKGKPLCIVIDDGSHVPHHQVLTFNTIFPILETGGIYIIEDVETSYWFQGEAYGYPFRYGLNHPDSFVEIMKRNVDCVNIEMCRDTYKPVMMQHTEHIDSITFSRNCIIIRKGEPNTRPYRFASYL